MLIAKKLQIRSRKPRAWGIDPKLGAGNLTFHFAGLGSDTTSNTTNSYGTVDGAALHTLVGLAENVVGTDWPTVLSIDCEGCEWAALEQMGRDPAALELLSGVHLLLIDAHLSPTMVPPTLSQFVSAMELLFFRLNFKLRWLRSVNGYPRDQQVVDFLGAAGLPAGFCCYEMALVREQGGGRRRHGSRSAERAPLGGATRDHAKE